jgi:dipeptidyl aminopeptidase/acylaminoacyl peptidase
MNAEQERVLRTWLDTRDPGDAPGRLRAAVRDVTSAERPPMFPALEAIRVRFRWASTPVRLGVLAVLLLAIAVAIAAAALLLRTPFRPQGLIAYSASNMIGGIRVVSADGSGDRYLTLGYHDKSPRWSPDGTSLLFIRFVAGPPGSVCDEQTSIVIHDLGSGTDRVLATVPIVVKAEWSPSGRQIAFLGLGSHECELSGSGLIDVTSGQVTTSDAGTGAGWFFWTGDAVTFLYSDHLGRVRAAAFSEHASEEDLFAFEDGDQAIPNPGGRYVALSNKPNPQRTWGLQIVDLLDGARVDLGPGFIGWWSPDGASVAFVQPGVPDTVSGRARDRLVVTVGADRRLRTLADVVVTGSPLDPVLGIPNLAWTSDGRAIYWRDSIGSHAVDVATGQPIDLPGVLISADDLQWQPAP